MCVKLYFWKKKYYLVKYKMTHKFIVKVTLFTSFIRKDGTKGTANYTATGSGTYIDSGTSIDGLLISSAENLATKIRQSLIAKIISNTNYTITFDGGRNKYSTTRGGDNINYYQIF